MLTLNYDVAPVAPAIRAKLFDCVRALRAADEKLNLALDTFDSERLDVIEPYDLAERLITVRLFAGILDSILDNETPAGSLGDRVYRAIVEFENENSANLPHVEGVILAFQLACDTVHEAIELQDCGIEWDAFTELAIAAYVAIRSALAWLTTNTVGATKTSAVLAGIIDGRQHHAMPARRIQHDEIGAGLELVDA